MPNNDEMVVAQYAPMLPQVLDEENESKIDNVSDLYRRYNHYNQLLFNGELPKIPIRIAKLSKVGGVVKFKVVTLPGTSPLMIRRKLAKRYLMPDSMHMEISNVYLRSDQGLDAILIHEMIHVKFAWIGDVEESHGYKFQEMAKTLGDIVGFEIPMTDDVRDLALSDQTSKAVCVIIWKTNRGYVYTILNSNSTKNQLDEITRYAERSVGGSYKSVSLYEITSAIWTKQATMIPAARKLTYDTKRYLMKPDREKELLNDLLKNGKSLIELGDKLEPVA